MSTPNFEAMGLVEPLLRAIQALNFTTPTDVQAQAIPNALAGGDWMVSSHTGSGKTLAFLTPILNRIMATGDSPLKAMVGPYALVLCPTRELAQQVSQDAINLLKQSKGIRVATVVGGTPFGKQIASLRGAQLVVSTPGRLLDLVNQRKLNLSGVEIMVVDEADRMLDLGFSEDLEAIHHLCENRDQTLMYSATFAGRVMVLASELMDNAQRLELSGASEANAKIDQHLFWADNHAHKRRLLNHWLSDASVDQAVVFASTQTDTEVIARELEADGHSAIALHGAMPQAVRNRRLKSLRDGQIKILVATDVAARGIDVPTISHVINFGMPMKPEDYIHRIGRTGRAGREGQAITLAEQSERRKVVAIERFIKQSIPVSVVEGMEPKPGGDRKSGGGSSFGKRREGGFGGGNGGGRDFDRRSSGPRGASSGARPAREFPAREFPPRGEFQPRGDFQPRPRFGDADGNRAPDTRSDRPATRTFSERDGNRETRSFGDKPARSFSGEGRSFGDKPARSFGDRPARSFGDKPARSFSGEGRSFGDKPARSFGDRDGNTAPRGDRDGNRFGDRPARSFGDKPARSFGGNTEGRSFGDRPARSFGDKPARSFGGEGRSFGGDRAPSGDRAARPRSAPVGRPKSFGDRPSFDSRRRG